jgi:hypothetical protein
LDDEFDRLLREAIIEELLCPLDSKFLGPVRFIYCYRPPQAPGIGPMPPARTFLDALPKSRQAAYAVSFEKHAQGHQLRGEKHHLLAGHEGLYEYKDIESKSRLIHTTDKWQLVVLLFGFTGKKENKIDQVHVNESERMRDEYRSRRASIEQKLKQKYPTRSR